MAAWFDALDPMARVFPCIAVPATPPLILQLALMIAGLGHDGSDADGLGHDGLDAQDLGHDYIDSPDPPDGGPADAPDSGLRLFTLWGIITFFTVLGWSGFAMVRGGVAGSLAVLGALALGAAGMILLARLMRFMLRLQQNGAMYIQNALGRSGEVYLTIPPGRLEPGKVTLLVQDRYTEFAAVTDEEAPIPSGSAVKVVGIADLNTLVVRSVTKGGKQAWSG